MLGISSVRSRCMSKFWYSERTERTIRVRESAKGFTLVEVLVSLLIFTLGIVSVAGLQVTNLSGNQSASNRVKAVWLVADIAERMRANPSGGVNGHYEFDSTSYTPPGSVCDFSDASGCTGEEVAQYDLWYWEALLNGREAPGMQMHSELPEAEAVIRDHGDGSYTIEVQWTDVFRGGLETHVVTERIYFYSQADIDIYETP